MLGMEFFTRFQSTTRSDVQKPGREAHFRGCGGLPSHHGLQIFLQSSVRGRQEALARRSARQFTETCGKGCGSAAQEKHGGVCPGQRRLNGELRRAQYHVRVLSRSGFYEGEERMSGQKVCAYARKKSARLCFEGKLKAPFSVSVF
jgi:hypothetical protein